MAKPKRDSALPLSEVRQLIDLALARGLTELEVSQGETRIRIRREVGHAAAPVAPPVAPAPAQQAERPEAHLLTIEAPMVGTFYRAPSPTADPYVREGDVIKEGQVLCVIEAMKLMNEIESKVAGRISKILVENGQPVEYGQPLFLIEPRA
ncbi:MAG: acetyl-CoA carboxylase biotin carboxyl carrier protein [Candidatus Rokubacteria bacterium]|nr:acetyl-CoA carboxylase biotin carboxyl carrier protein [Candidatus Rokubacteria bacterium]